MQYLKEKFDNVILFITPSPGTFSLTPPTAPNPNLLTLFPAPRHPIPPHLAPCRRPLPPSLLSPPRRCLASPSPSMLPPSPLPAGASTLRCRRHLPLDSDSARGAARREGAQAGIGTWLPVRPSPAPSHCPLSLSALYLHAEPSWHDKPPFHFPLFTS